MNAATADAALVRRYYAGMSNRRNLALLQEHLPPDVAGHGPGAGDIVRASVSATHRATGKPVRFSGVTECRLDLYDRQLGVWRP